MLVIDLFSGSGSASECWKSAGHQVIRLDLQPGAGVDIIADCRELPPAEALRPFLLWMSPPCTEFSRLGQPGIFPPPQPEPDMSCVEAARRAVQWLQPVWWVLENVRGAAPYLGRPRQICGAFYLWGHFPRFNCDPAGLPRKEHIKGGNRAAKRAMIPPALSEALMAACLSSRCLFDAYGDLYGEQEPPATGRTT